MNHETATPPPACPHLPSALLEGMCLRCLLRVGLAPLEPPPEGPVDDSEEPLPRRFGDYELLEKLGRGSMGEVYKAFNIPLERLEALKMTRVKRAGDAPTSAAPPHPQVMAEAQAAARLKHPNIVPIHHVDAVEGRFFTMELMEGGSLDKQMERFRAPRAAARLMETVARAVHYGHQRLVLHRDLKPANLLLDAAGVPHVADFGLAQELDTQPRNGEVAGTLLYMAPEQADPQGPPLTVAADIHGLGSILYELLTGRPPFLGATAAEVLQQLRTAEPLPPRTLVPKLPRDLEHICLKCLRKEPSQRYGSAAELADDLQRFLQGEPLPPAPRRRRVLAWFRRHPLGAGLLVTLVWSLAVAAVGAFRIARAQEDDLRRDALRVNLYAAKLVAGAVLFELAQYRQVVERAAARPELGAALQARDAAALESFCRRRFTFHGGPRGSVTSSDAPWPFQRCFILDRTGQALAHWPPPPRIFVGDTFGWRDYFHGARRLASDGLHAAYVSRAFRGTSDGKNTFAFSAPVYAADGTWAGAVVATVASDSTLGSLRLDDSSDCHRTAMLVGLTDRPEPLAALPGRDVYSVLVHERLDRGMPITLEPQTARQLERALPEPAPHGQEQFLLSPAEGRVLEGYRDPVSDEPGTWLATFAPVGHTGFAVIVQTREKAVLAVNTLLVRRIAAWSVPFALGAALLWLLGWYRYRASREPTA